MINYGQNIYLDQYGDLRIIYTENVREPMLNSIKTYDKMKRWYPFELIDLRFQVDHISPKKRFFEEYEHNPANTIFIYF